MLNHLVAIGAMGVICAVWAVLHLRKERRMPDPAVCALCAEQELCGPMGIHAREEKVCPHEPPRSERPLVLAVVACFGGIGLIAAIIALHRSANRESTFREVEQALMGTTWSITAAPRNGQGEVAIDEAFAEVSRIESLMSEWIPGSPVSAINEAAGRSEVAVPAELAELLERSLSYSEASSGAFDVTWRGMANIWNIYDEAFVPPTADRIDATRRKVDFRKLRLREGRVFLQEEGMAIGLGAIAKGYAVDRAAGVLIRRGITDFVVDGGGDLYAHGSRNGKPWRVGIRHPRGTPDQLIAVGEIFTGAFVTSGDYERFKIREGIRYHHIIDPRTGRPADACQSVSVYATSTETADALATGAFVLGPDRGKELIEKWGGAEALFVDSEGRVTMTEGFRSIMRNPESETSAVAGEPHRISQLARREER